MCSSSLAKLYCVIMLAGMPVEATMAQAGCGDCAKEYLDAAEGRRIQARIDYLNPDDVLDLDRTRKRETNDDSDDVRGSGASGAERFIWTLISVGVLATIAVIIFQNRAGGLVVFGRAPDDAVKPTARRGARAAGAATGHDLPTSEAAFLAEIERMADRREALHLLAGRLLSHAAERTGIRPGRSWTARESLRALPRDWAHLADLKHLNRQAELAWFGGRAVDDGLFADCLERARGILRVRAAR